MFTFVICKWSYHGWNCVRWDNHRIGNWQINCHSRSSELQLFDRPYVTSFWWSIVTLTLSWTVSEILPHLQCMWLSVTLRRPYVLKRQLKLQATSAFRFMCKHIVVNTCYISRGTGVRKVTNSTRSLLLVPFDITH